MQALHSMLLDRDATGTNFLLPNFVFYKVSSIYQYMPSRRLLKTAEFSELNGLNGLYNRIV
jgi:hypothetical protein